MDIKRTKTQNFFLLGHYFYRCLGEGKHDTEGGGRLSPPLFGLPNSNQLHCNGVGGKVMEKVGI